MDNRVLFHLTVALLALCNPSYAKTSKHEHLDEKIQTWDEWWSSLVGESFSSSIATGPSETLNKGGTCKKSRPCGKPVFSKIIGGHESSIKKRPWQAGLFISKYESDGSGSGCGASIIGDRWLLSAAHCFDYIMEDNVKEGKLINQYTTVFMGSGGYYGRDWDNAQVLEAAEVYINGDYGGGPDYKNDVALLKLRDPISFGEGVQPICLRTDPSWVKAGTNCIASGWGTTENQNDESYSEQLMELSVPILSTCGSGNDEKFNINYDVQFCAGYNDGGKDTCQGDSGGPLACPNSAGAYFLEGVVSFGNECALKDFPGVYARVSHFMENGWVQGHIDGDCYTT